MESKSTDVLSHEIKAATDIEDFLTANHKHLVVPSLPDYLNALLEEKGITRADAVRGSLLDRAYLYQIFSGEKTPSRDKLIALAFGMRLSDVEAQRMLKLSGNRELYARDKRDALILFALQKGNDILAVNVLLSGHGLRALGVAG